MRPTSSLVLAAVCSLLLSCGCRKKSEPAPAANPAADAPTTPNAPQAGSKPSAPANPALKAPPPGPPVVVNGLTIDIQKAERAIPSYDLQASLANVRYSLRYQDFNTATATLQKLAADPNLNQDQKATVNEVMQQVRKASAAPSQAP